jgi:hypothetical protein
MTIIEVDTLIEKAMALQCQEDHPCLRGPLWAELLLLCLESDCK